MPPMRYVYLLEVLVVAIQRCSTTTTKMSMYNKKTDGEQSTGQFQKGFSAVECASLCADDTSIPCRRFSYHADSKECYLFNSTNSLDKTGQDTYGRDCASHPGYTFYNNTHCVKHYMTPRKYMDAEKDCKNANAHLLTMEKMSDFGLFKELGVSWIDGGKNRMTWYGADLPWTKWGAGGYPRSNECPYAVSTGKSMFTQVCSEATQYICQIDC